jgi:Ca2+/Na+ antiporter
MKYMDKMHKLYPLMSYRIKILGFILLIVTIILLIISLLNNSQFLDLISWLSCFALFCIVFSKEKDEDINSENSYLIILRYHSLRIAIALTTVVALIGSFTFILEKRPIEITCLMTLIFYFLSYLIVYYLLKLKERAEKRIGKAKD